MSRTRYPGWWARYWFADGSPYNLAAARIVVALLTFWIVLSKDLPGVSGQPLVFWATVPESRQWRYLLFPGHAPFEYVVETLALVALLAAALGVYARLSCFLAALLVYHLAPLETIVSGHDPGLEGLGTAILALTVLAFSPCDAVWAPRHRTRGIETWEYRWPVCLLQILVVQVYLFSAYGKLASAGLDWISGENIRRWVWLFSQWPNVGVFHSIGPSLARQAVIPDVIAVATITMELAFPLVLISSRVRRVLVPIAVIFHVGVVFAMNLFYKNAFLLLLFVDWTSLRGRLHGLWVLTLERLGLARRATVGS